MSINGKFDNIGREDLLAFAQQNNIKNAKEIIDQILENAFKWPEIAKECGVPKQIIETILPEMKLSI